MGGGISKGNDNLEAGYNGPMEIQTGHICEDLVKKSGSSSRKLETEDLTNMKLAMKDAFIQKEFYEFVSTRGKRLYLKIFGDIELFQGQVEEKYASKPAHLIDIKDLIIPDCNTIDIEDETIKMAVNRSLCSLEKLKTHKTINFDHLLEQIYIAEEILLNYILEEFHAFVKSSDKYSLLLTQQISSSSILKQFSKSRSEKEG